METVDLIKEKLVEVLSNYDESINDSKLISLTTNKDNTHGDFSTNMCLRLSKKVNMNPLDFAKLVVSKLYENDKPTIKGIIKIEACSPGFINFYVESDIFSTLLKEIVSENENYGQLEKVENTKICLEYVSANPTGTLHLGHARGAAIGDSLARILKKAGYDVTREYYINDSGNQVNNLAKSILVRSQQYANMNKRMPKNGYYGEEVKELAKTIVDKYKDKYLKNNKETINFLIQEGTKYLLDKIINDLKNFRVEFDVFSSETKIRNSGRIEECLKRLSNYTYISDKATYLNTTKDGDDKDRVLIKSDGSYSYFTPDIAYHDYKYARGFNQLIDVLGADHHGYIARLKSAMKSLGHDPESIRVPLVQMVRLFKDGKEFKMSKRSGNAISMKELMEEVSVDSVRYFFVSRSASQHLDFNIDLAKTLGNTNPVYYAQYTHARFCSILQKAKDNSINEFDYSTTLLNTDEEKSLMKLLNNFKKVISDSATTLEPYKICNYIQDLSTSVNYYYQKYKVLDLQNLELTKQRLSLVNATRIVLKNALDLIGVSAPEKM